MKNDAITKAGAKIITWAFTPPASSARYWYAGFTIYEHADEDQYTNCLRGPVPSKWTGF